MTGSVVKIGAKSLAVILQDGCFDIVRSSRQVSSVLNIQEVFKLPVSPSASDTWFSTIDCTLPFPISVGGVSRCGTLLLRFEAGVSCSGALLLLRFEAGVPTSFLNLLESGEAVEAVEALGLDCLLLPSSSLRKGGTSLDLFLIPCAAFFSPRLSFALGSGLSVGFEGDGGLEAAMLEAEASTEFRVSMPVKEALSPFDSSSGSRRIFGKPSTTPAGEKMLSGITSVNYTSSHTQKLHAAKSLLSQRARFFIWTCFGGHNLISHVPCVCLHRIARRHVW